MAEILELVERVDSAEQLDLIHLAVRAVDPAGEVGARPQPLRHAEDIVKTKRRLNEIYAKHCGRTYEEVDATLDRDHFMNSMEAKAWGIVDHVYESRESAEGGEA